MRLVGTCVFLAALVVACRAPNASGPAWPAPSTTADDGGESIEPQSTTVAASVEQSADDKDNQPSKPVAEEKVEPASTDDKSPTPSQPQPSPSTDDILMTDDLIIEIED